MTKHPTAPAPGGRAARHDNTRTDAPDATGPWRAHPLGATVHAGVVNFAFFSQHATGMELLRFDKHDDPEPV